MPEHSVEQLADGLWKVSGERYRAVFAEGESSVVAVNTLSTPASARAYREVVERTVPDKPIQTLITTIDHLDHSGFGADLAPDAEVIAHELTARVISSRAAGGQLIPSRTVSGEGETLRLDDVSVQLFYPGPTQGSGNLAVLFPDARVLFMVGPQADARYGLFPDVHVKHYATSVRRLLDLEWDTFVAARYDSMDRDRLARACDFFEALQEATQQAFAQGLPVWEIDTVGGYCQQALGEQFGDLEGFERHLPTLSLRVVTHYLMGGWGLEDTEAPELVLR